MRAILGQFWQDAETPDAEKAMEVEGWMDVLENCAHSEIRNAWRKYQTNDNNRTRYGNLRRPDAGILRKIILEARPRPKVAYSAPPPQPERTRCDAKTAQAICEAAGFTPKRMVGGDDV